MQSNGLFAVFAKLSLPLKINLAIGLIFLLVITSATLYSAHLEKNRALEHAKEETRSIATFYFDSLNTMMLTGTMDQRTLLRNKILRRSGIVDAKVIRGEPVKQQFGPGYPEEQPQDELDYRGLRGEDVILLEKINGQRVLTVVTPFSATEDTRGVNCLQCHDVNPGSVNGAIKIRYSLAEIDKEVERGVLFSTGMNIILIIVGLGLVQLLLRRWISMPVNNLMEAVMRRAAGDSKARVVVRHYDEVGRLGLAFNAMAEKVEMAVKRESEAAQDLRNKVDILLDVVSRAAKGDLGGQVSFSGRDAIGELGEVIQIMIDNVRHLLEEKHHTVEELQSRVDDILQVVTRAAEGDLTGKVNTTSNDVIGRLALSVQRMIKNLNTLVAQVQQSGIKVTSSITEIAATAKQQEAHVAQQAATVNDVAATSTQISSTAKELLVTMDDMSKVVEKTATSAMSGHGGLHTLGAIMRKVVESSSSIATKLEILNEKGRNINTVVTTITKVADQTNLLSLNAAIEAEKAGEFGLGFSVVATEIRRLADQTAVASWDIEQMVKEIQAAVAAGVTSVEAFSQDIKRSVEDVNQVSGQLAHIIEQVQALRPQFEIVHVSVQSQSAGAEQIKESIMRLNDFARETLQSLRQSHGAISRLNEAAHALDQGVSRFRVDGPSSKK